MKARQEIEIDVGGYTVEQCARVLRALTHVGTCSVEEAQKRLAYIFEHSESSAEMVQALQLVAAELKAESWPVRLWRRVWAAMWFLFHGIPRWV